MEQQPTEYANSFDGILTIRIQLVDSQPPIWRSVELASSMSLTRIHAILQTAFGWYDEHLHRFTAADPYERLKPVNGEIVEPPQWLPAEFCDAPTDLPEEECSLDDLLKAGDGTAFYEYDFGDSWLHRLDLTSRRRRKPTDPPARVLDGRPKRPARRFRGDARLRADPGHAGKPIPRRPRTSFAVGSGDNRYR